MKTEENKSMTLQQTGKRLDSRRDPELILSELIEADRVLRVLSQVANCLPKKLYNKRKSHKRAAFVAKKRNRFRLTKHNQFTLKLMKAKVRFDKLEQEWRDSQRNFTIKEAIAHKA